MTDPRYTDPRYSDPPPVNADLRSQRGNAAMWAWAAGIAVVILIAFILAAGWNSNPRTVSMAPTETTGMGTTATHPTPPPAATGHTPGAPAVAPSKPAPQPAPAAK